MQRSPVSPFTPVTATVPMAEVMTPSAIVGAVVAGVPGVVEMSAARAGGPAASFEDILAAWTDADGMAGVEATGDVEMSDVDVGGVGGVREEEEEVNPLTYVRSYGRSMEVDVENQVQSQSHKGYLPAWLRT